MKEYKQCEMSAVQLFIKLTLLSNTLQEVIVTAKSISANIVTIPEALQIVPESINRTF